MGTFVPYESNACDTAGAKFTLNRKVILLRVGEMIPISRAVMRPAGAVIGSCTDVRRPIVSWESVVQVESGHVSASESLKETFGLKPSRDMPPPQPG